MTGANRLDAALEGRGAPPDGLRQLVVAATEVAEAFAAERLSGAQRERILERSLRLLEHSLAVPGPRRRRISRMRRSRPMVVGGAALVVAAAAVGWTLVRGRRPAITATV